MSGIIKALSFITAERVLLLCSTSTLNTRMIDLIQLSTALGELSLRNDNYNAITYTHSLDCSDSSSLSEVNTVQNQYVTLENSATHQPSIALGCLCSGIFTQNPDMVYWALQKGCDANSDLSGLTPLTLCVAFTNSHNVEKMKSIISILLRHGSKINQRERRTASRQTPLLMACNKKLLSLVDLLLSHGASPNLCNLETGKSPLEITLELLIEEDMLENNHNLVLQASHLLSSPDIEVTGCNNTNCSARSTLELTVLTGQMSIIATVIKKGHLNFSQGAVRAALNATQKLSISTQVRNKLHHLLMTQLLPDSLQHLSADVIHCNAVEDIKSTLFPRSTQLSKLMNEYQSSNKRSQTDHETNQERNVAFEYLLQL